MSSATREDLTGKVLLNKLRVVSLLGEGGMGAVYEVEHLLTRHRRALKVMHRSLAQNPDTVARFVREAGVAGTLRSPYVVETFDAGQLEDGSPYVLMELVRGRSLADLFEAHEPLTAGRVVGLACQVLEGLSVAHAAGIIHRDVKPDNIFVAVDERGNERVRILDFGISKFLGDDLACARTADGAVLGTPYYMSPEQSLGLPVTPASDVYSVGVLLYEGLAGQRPYDAATLPALVLKIHHGEHTQLAALRPQLPPGLAAIVEQAMSVKPEARFESALAMLEALSMYGDSHYVTSLKTLGGRALSPLAETIEAAPERPPEARVIPENDAAATAPVGSPEPPVERAGRGGLVGFALVAAVALLAVGLWLGRSPSPSAEVVPEPAQVPFTPALGAPDAGLPDSSIEGRRDAGVEASDAPVPRVRPEPRSPRAIEAPPGPTTRSRPERHGIVESFDEE